MVWLPRSLVSCTILVARSIRRCQVPDHHTAGEEYGDTRRICGFPPRRQSGRIRGTRGGRRKGLLAVQRRVMPGSVWPTGVALRPLLCSSAGLPGSSCCRPSSPAQAPKLHRCCLSGPSHTFRARLSWPASAFLLVCSSLRSALN